jgi:nitrogen fixation-related uncharacterized protein
MKKRTKVILVVVAVVLGISAGGYFLYDAQVRQDDDKLREYGQQQDVLAEKLDEAIDMGDYVTARVYLDSISVLRGQLKENLKHSTFTDKSEDTFEYLQQRYQLLIEAGESLEAGDSLSFTMCLSSISDLDANYCEKYPGAVE